MPRPRRSLDDFLSEGGQTKESRPFLITDTAFFGFKAVAVKQGFGGNIGAFMEQLSRKLQDEHLTDEEKAHVKKTAQQETNKRRERRLTKAGFTEQEEQQQQ